MVDINRCRMVYEDNEHEYEDFYDHSSDASSDNESDAEGDGVAGARELTAQLGTLSVATQRHVQRDTRAGGTAAADWELSLPQAGGVGAGGSSSNGRVLGSREMARYYKQRPRPADVRGSVAANTALAAHRALTVGALAGAPVARPPPAEARAQRERRRAQRQWLNLALRTNVNNNLPKNVPY
jgi:pre-60S factor REI1